MTSQAPDEIELLLDRYAREGLTPEPGQLASGRVAMLDAFSAARVAPEPSRRLLHGWSLAGALALLLIGSTSIVVAESGPGQPFYGLRLAIGSVTLPGGEPAHDRGLAAQLEDRLAEVRAAARDGDARGALAAIHEYLDTLRELTRNGVTDPEILALLQRHEAALHDLLTVAPNQATDGLQEAYDAAGKVKGVVTRPTPADGGDPSPRSTGKP
jgi:hypothetical protein